MSENNYSRLRENYSKKMFSILLIIVYLISFESCTAQTNQKDVLIDTLNSAALEVISLHLSSLQSDRVEEENSRNKRSFAHISDVPHLDNSRLDLIPYPELMKSQQITDLMLKLKERFVFQQAFLQKVSESLKYAVRSKSNHMIGTNSFIRSIQTTNGVNVSNIKKLENIIWQNSKLIPQDLKYRIKDLRNNLNIVEQRLRRISSVTGDVVLINKPSIITGHKNFIGRNEISYLNTSTSFIGTVGHQDLINTLRNLYRISRPQTLKGVKHFVKSTVVEGSVTTSFTNGIDLNKQIVTTNTPQMISGHISYSTELTVTNDLTIKGKINGFDLNKDIVFLNQPDIIYAPKIFTTPLIITQNVNTFTVDGIDLRFLSKNVLFSNGSQTINSKLILVKPLFANSISVAGQVNGIDISAMAEQIVYKNRPVLVKGHKTFILDDFLIKNNLFVANKLDGRKIPEDIFTINGNQVITGEKILNGMTRFEGIVSVKGLVDELHLPEEILRLTKNETIFGPIIFGDGIIVDKNIEAHRLVDGVDLSELKLHSLKTNDRIIRSDVRFNRGVIIGTIEQNGSVNGINLRYLFNEVIFKGSKSVQIHGTKHFRAHVDIEQLFVEQLNGVNISHFVSTNRNEIIFGEKHFAGITSFNSINVKGLIDRVNFENLYNNRISLSRSERINGTKNFLNELVVSDWLSVRQKINGITPQLDIVLKSKFQEINGSKIFRQDLNLINLKAINPIFVNGKVDNIIINDLNFRSVPLNFYKSLFLNAILINCNSTITKVYNNLNGINFTNFANNVMSLTKPQTIFSPKKFNNVQHFYQITSSKGINGISMSALNANAVHLNGNSLITAPFTFAHHINLEKPLVIDGVVNGVNLSYIVNDCVYKRGSNLITGHNIFRSGFRVNGDINAMLFNGVDLSTQLLTNNRDHTIKGKVQFSKSVNINNGSLALNGLVNDIDLSEFNKRVMKTHAINLIEGNLELMGYTKILSNLKVSGKLNGIEINKFFNDAVFLNGNQEITGTKTMVAGVQFLKNLNSISMNNINIPITLKEIVFIDSPIEQYINSPKIFTNNVTINGLIHANSLTSLGPINSINLFNLNSETIKINKPTFVYGMKHFKDNAVISNNITQIYGLLNDIDLIKDVIHLHFNNKVTQVIKGRKTFEHLVLNENAVIRGLVNGLNLKSINENTFYSTGNQRVNSRLWMRKMVQFNGGNNLVSILNGMKVEELITLRDNQTIFAHLIFNNPLIVNQNLMVSGYVSGQNLSKLANESLVKDLGQVLHQPIKFDTIVFRQDVKVDQHVDNLDLSALSNTVKEFTRKVNMTKDVLLMKTNRFSRISDYLYKSFEKSVFEIDYFVLYQVLDEVYGDHIEVQSNGIFSMSSNKEMTSTVHTMKYNTKSEMFDIEITRNSQSLGRKVFHLKDEEYVINMNPINSHNISSQITRSGQLVGSLGYFALSVDILNIGENTALLISLLSDGKLTIHLLQSLPNHKNSLKQITELIVGIETSKVVAFLIKGDVYVAIARNYGMNCKTDTSGTLIFVLRDYKRLELIQTISHLNIVNVVHFENHGKHYLALSDVTSPLQSKSPQTVFIYRNDHNIKRCSFSLFQKLPFDNAIHLTAFSFGTIYSEEQYLTVANSTHIVIWKQEGESGFTKNWWLHTKSAHVITPIIAWNHIFIIVGQNNKCHQSLIFRAETKGSALAPIIFKSNV